VAEASAAAKRHEGTSSTWLLIIGATLPDGSGHDSPAEPLAGSANDDIAKRFEVDELVSSCRVQLPR
jgi:hypothetical protein